MYHKKMIITEKAVYITSANFTLDYFLVTGDFSCYIRSDNPKYFPLRDALLNSYQNDWINHAESIDTLSCLAAKIEDQKYQNPQNPALQNLLYINPNDICKQPYKCNINFDKPLCVDGFDSKSNLCKVTKEGFTKGELIGTVLGIIIAVTIICFVFSLLI